MSGRNFSLTDHLSRFIDEQVANGRHQNASEVVREALRRYEDDMKHEEAQIAAIREIIRDGRDAKARGEFETIRGAEDEAKLFEEMTGRPARWLKRGSIPRV